MLDDLRARKETPVKITAINKLQMSVISKRLAVPILRKDTAQGYLVNDSCTQCGICAKVCPADNITVTDKVRFSDRCEVCYACLHNCPQNAIHLRKEASPVRFRNEHISLKDIIEANE
ncbi:MAG: EFR1 family ferrodoxin [Firmicutes bacterium]|nr:EFR1 family ferrodoxin [Bacillota bacterium]